MCDDLLFQCKQGGCVNSAIQCDFQFVNSEVSYFEPSYLQIVYGNVQTTQTQVYKCNKADAFQCQAKEKCFQYKDVCVYDTDMNGQSWPCYQFTHLFYCRFSYCSGTFKCHRSYCLPVHKVCNGVSDCPSADDEKDCVTILSCPGMLKCRSGSCVHPEKICDGQIHCGTEAEDEHLCATVTCPQNCICLSATVICSKTPHHIVPQMTGEQYIRKLVFTNNQIIHLNWNISLLKSTIYVNLSCNNIHKLPSNSGAFLESCFLLLLDLYCNKIKHFEKDVFAGLEKLEKLFLSGIV